MEIGQAGLDLLEEFEGFRANAYYDSVRIPTIGFGLTRYFHRPGAPKVKMGDVISFEEAQMALEWVANDFLRQVEDSILIDLMPNEVDAIACFVYNVGVAAFKSSTLLKKLNAGDIEGAADEFLRWDKAGGVKVRGLTRRRVAERELFLALGDE